MPAKPQKVALGFVAHTGWAVVVGTAGSPSAPTVVYRAKFEMIPKASIDPTRFVFHAAAKLALPDAKRLVKTSEALARKNAARTVGTIIAELREAGHTVAACGIVGGNRPLPATLEAILAAHPYLHAAEGDLFRQAIVAASEVHQTPVTEVPAKDLYAEGSDLLGITPPQVKQRLVDLGAAVGKPWSKDHREALLVALLALKGKGR